MARADTAAPVARRTHLPRTASNLSLVELIAGLSLGSGLLLRSLRTRSSEAL